MSAVEATKATVTVVLASHLPSGRPVRLEGGGYGFILVCSCGKWSAPIEDDDSDRIAHRTHVAAAVLAALDGAT